MIMKPKQLGLFKSPVETAVEKFSQKLLDKKQIITKYGRKFYGTKTRKVVECGDFVDPRDENGSGRGRRNKTIV